jgi:hypothetical protein
MLGSIPLVVPRAPPFPPVAPPTVPPDELQDPDVHGKQRPHGWNGSAAETIALTEKPSPR